MPPQKAVNFAVVSVKEVIWNMRDWTSWSNIPFASFPLYCLGMGEIP